MEKQERIKRYNERHSTWNTQVINQFGYTTNLFTTIGIGFLSFLISNKEKYPKICIDRELSIDWDITFYMLTLLFTFISVCFGSISIISRLYDLRLTRHIIVTRRKVYIEFDKLLPNKFVNINKESLFRTFLKIFLKKINFIEDLSNTDFKDIKTQFENLRKQSIVLGRLSWKAHKIQILILIISILTYLSTIFF